MTEYEKQKDEARERIRGLLIYREVASPEPEELDEINHEMQRLIKRYCLQKEFAGEVK